MRLLDFYNRLFTQKMKPMKDDRIELLKKIESSLSTSSEQSAVSIKGLFENISDDFYFWLLTEGLDSISSQKLKSLIPTMPDEQIQLQFTGRSGHLALQQAFDAYTLFKKILEENSNDIKRFDNILDFGCGWGRITRFFLKDIAPERLWGIDCYKEMIDLCKTQNLRCNFDVTDPMPPTHFESDSFDLIYLYSVFSHLSEEAHLAWLHEFKRILKKDGMVIATTRPRSFIEDCRELSRRPNIEDWQRGPAHSFQDPEKALADYDSGKFVYAPIGGGGVLIPSFYGETCIPKKYVENNWKKIFRDVGYITVEEHQAFDQDVIFAKK